MRLGRVLLCAVLAPGCYSFTPVSLEQVQPGAEVRVFLSPAAPGAASPLSEGESFVDGLVLAAEPSRLILGRRWRDPALAYRTGSPRERVPVAAADIVLVQIKEVDAVRTGLLAGAIAIGTGYLIHSLLRGGGSAGRPPTNGNGTF